mmetsp:Transcript_17499/g.25023  ORF Transcript_17499/g.25023 Transcript_17499/m.25023 type:complete len:134 (-) Transcript_17499:276-677(-)
MQMVQPVLIGQVQHHYDLSSHVPLGARNRFVLSRTQMSDPPEQGNEVQTDGNEQRCVSADSSPPSEDDETEEQMQASYDSDMNMIKNLKNMLQKLKEINDNIKLNKAEMTNEVTDLRVEREILIAEGKGPSRC